MNKTTILILSIVFTAVLLITAGALYMKQYFPKYQWFPGYSCKSKEPYGTKYLHDILKGSYSRDQFVDVNQPHKSLIGDSQTNSLLFYIGYNTYYDSLSIEWYKDYMLRGNKICVASTRLPFQLINSIFHLDSANFHADSFTDSIVSAHFIKDTNKVFNFHFQMYKKKSPFEWEYISDTAMNSYRRRYLYESLSVIDTTHSNFVEIKYGRGALFVYTTPLLLTNYYITTKEGYDYANRFFETMGKPDKFYWDNFSNFPNIGIYSEEKNPLEFILSKKELRLTWYLFLFTTILFILFKLKRRQSPVPVLTADKNASVEYAKAVGLLHYKTSTQTDLAEQLMKLFFSYIKERYKIVLDQDKDKQKKQIALYSGVNIDVIEKIYKQQISIKYNPEPDKSQTIKLHSLLDYFYKNCK